MHSPCRSPKEGNDLVPLVECLSLKDEDQLIFELKPVVEPQPYGLNGCETWTVCFSPDGTHFAWSAGYGLVRVLPWPIPFNFHAADSMTEEKRLNCGDIVWGMAFGPRDVGRAKPAQEPTEGQELLLATGLHNGTIKVWVVSTGQILFNLSGHQSVVRDLVFMPNGSLTLLSSSRDKTLRVWDLAKKGTPFRVLSGPDYCAYKCSVSPDSSMVASICCLDSYIYLWSLQSFTCIRNLKYEHERIMVSCDFSADGALLAAGSHHIKTGFCLDLWDPYTAELLIKVANCELCENGGNLLTDLTFCPVFPYLAFTEFRALQIWDMERDKLIMIVDHRQINRLCCAFHPGGGVIATGYRNGHVKFWRIPRVLQSLQQLCRSTIRRSLSNSQVQALSVPKKFMDFLQYRYMPKKRLLRCDQY